jgi:hypothetical protein
LHRFPEPSIGTPKKLDAGEALARSKPTFAKSRSVEVIESAGGSNGTKPWRRQLR